MVSACLGALVGLIRQWSEQAEKPHETEFAGVRTFSLFSVLGCVGAALSEQYSAAVLPAVIVVIGAHLVVQQVRLALGGHGGSTTFAASLLTVLVGTLVQWDQTQAAVLTAAATVLLLGLKQPIHALTRHFTIEDIRATMQFVAITGVVLPLVPNRNFGPFEAFNPQSTWLMVVLISGLGFVGYVLMRTLGSNAGILLTSLLGGLASSTAATLAFSRRSRAEPALSSSYSLAVVLACTVMLPRVIVAVGMLNQTLMRSLFLPLGLMALPGLGYGLWLWYSSQHAPGGVGTPSITNPLSLGIAIKFALAYAIIAFLVKAATQLEWQAGMLPLSFVSGLTDMDAIALTMANNHSLGFVGSDVAVRSVIIAAVGNSVMKGGMAIAVGTPALRRHVAVAMGMTVIMGMICLWLAGR